MPALLVTRRRLLGSGLALSLFDGFASASPAEPPDGFFRLEAAPAALRLLSEPAAETEILAYNGEVPGPLIRCKKGEELKIRLVNRLAEPTSLIWPGLRLANAMDGVAGLTQAPVAPGESFDYRFAPPDSGLFAYRPGFLPVAAEQFGRGLYGALIVDEPDPPHADRDLIAVIADWRLDEKGAIAPVAREDGGGGGLSELVTVNSKPAPVAETMTPGARVRLRLVSAVAARIMSVSFDGVKPMILAIDGEPADSAFEPMKRTIPVGPGARFDVMFDLPAEAGAKARLVLHRENEPDLDLLVFATEGEKRAELAPIASLPLNPLLPMRIRLEAAKRAAIVIEPAGPPASGEAAPPLVPALAPTLTWTINGAPAPPFAQKPLLTVKRGSPVALAIVNRSALTQDLHVRGHHVRLLHDLDDGWEPYWRDSILVAPGKTKQIAFVADRPGKWAIFSFIAGREARGLTAWFLVT